MSNPFYKYLSEKVIKFFQTNMPMAGDKFFVQFETEEQVNNLYTELEKNIVAKEFVYNDSSREQRYISYQLSFGTIDMVIAASMEGGPHPDFLATLRNLVGVEQGYENKAILFIHCSSLDSILGGAGSLYKEGMPFNVLSIEKDIERKIAETEYSELDKEILNLYLKNKKKELDDTTASIFEYEDVICSLNDSQITADEYRKFELFPDEKLAFLSGKKLHERLEENHRNYVRIAEIHSYGVDETRLEKHYGESGAKVLKKPDWESVSYVEIEKFLLSRKKTSTIEYIPILSNFLIWDKEEGISKAKSRTRNIILFVTSGEKTEIALSFTDFTKKNGIDIPEKYQSILKCEASGKRLLVELSGIEDKAAFYHFKYNGDGAKFVFKMVVLRCSSSLLENIKTQYSIEMKRGNVNAIRINTDEDEVVFNEFASDRKTTKIIEENQVVSIKSNERVTVSVCDNYPYSELNDDVVFSISTENFVIPLIKAFAIEKPTVIEGMKLWYLKQIKQTDFEIVGDNSLVFGTKRYFARDEFRKTLELEKNYIRNATPFAVEYFDNCEKLKGVDMKLPKKVSSAFDDIVSYFNNHKLIPSLTYFNDDISELYKEYLNAIISVIESVPEGGYLSEEERNIFYLGMIKRQYGDYEILLTPLHPINVAYQLYIKKEKIDGLEDTGIDLLRKFQHTALLPYINIDPYSKESKLYIPIEQIHSPEWKIYVEECLPRYKGSKDFVSKLVAEKVKEFVEHFSYLFSRDTSASIRINLINTGDCREIVQGIIKYYVHELNTSNSKRVIPVRVTMYSDVKIDTAFGVMSQIDNVDVLVKSLGIEARVDDMSMDEIIDVYRRNVQFYYKSMDDDFEYAHITFLELDDDNQVVNTLMQDIPSGIVMNGISSGVPSEMLGDSYRTGFGTKYLIPQTTLIDIAVKYNSINAAMSGEAYRRGACYAIKMNMSKQKTLDRIYDASNWVTFINPKVDLSYFKSDYTSKDLLIIHYSDQYNPTSSRYDAITVTKKSKQYQNAISRYLLANGVDDADRHSKQIINIFNALNGDWLLRMLSSYKLHFPVEKLSILSAMKLAVKRYAVPGVIWVPISLEEILRVSGAVGLSQSGSIFSAKNLGFEGATSDDLLLVGIKPGEKVQVTFYPIEVKIGKVGSDYLEKGIKQAQKTRQIFDEVLELGACCGKAIRTRLYRNFFMQQVMVNADKLLLYEVGDGNQGWEEIVKSDLRRKLLEEEYEIVETIVPDMGKAAVLSFREDCFDKREFRHQDILIVEKTKKEGVNILVKDFSSIDTVEWSLVKDEESIPERENELLDRVTDDASGVDDVKSEKVIAEIDSLNNVKFDEAVDEPKEIRVLIGRDKYFHEVYWEFGSKALANRHLLITGISGQGKTYAIQAMLYELVKSNISTVIFDYTEGYTLQQLEEPFKESLGEKISQYIVYSAGVPINPFRRHEVDLAGQKILEKESDVAARLADIFVHVYDFGSQQYSAIFDAAYNGMKVYGNKMDMRYFRGQLEKVAETNKAAKSVLSKMSPFFHTVEFTNDVNFDWGNILYSDNAKINIIQLTLFSREMQVIITEMMLWDAWYFTKKYGSKDRPFAVVLDEAQNLSHTIKAPSAAILTEGRKFGWSAWFATQSLKVLKDDEVVRLLQSAFKLYFKPTDDEMIKIAKQLDAAGGVNWLPEIQKLKKGQCIVVGDKRKANGMVGPAEPVITDISSFDARLSKYSEPEEPV